MKTVADLIEELSKYEPSLNVFTWDYKGRPREVTTDQLCFCEDDESAKDFNNTHAVYVGE